MFDRRTAARREWSVWWRYALALGVIEAAAWMVGRVVAPSPALVGPLAFGLALYTAFALVLLGIATALLVRYHVRTRHVWLGAMAANAPLLAAAVLPYQYRVPCFVLAAALSVAWVVVVARTSMKHADPRLGYLCRACFYDLRGLTGELCPECGTPITGPVQPPQRPADAAAR